MVGTKRTFKIIIVYTCNTGILKTPHILPNSQPNSINLKTFSKKNHTVSAYNVNTYAV